MDKLRRRLSNIAMAFIKRSAHHTTGEQDMDIHVHDDHEWDKLGQASH